MNLRETPLNVPDNHDGRYCSANGWTLENYHRAKLAYETYASSLAGWDASILAHLWSSLSYHEQCAWRSAAAAIVVRDDDF